MDGDSHVSLVPAERRSGRKCEPPWLRSGPCVKTTRSPSRICAVPAGVVGFPVRVDLQFERLRRLVKNCKGVVDTKFFLQLAGVFLAYFIAGILGQATTNIRSSNLGPVWPAYGVALAAFLAYGYRVLPAVCASALLVAIQGSVSPIAATGQACAATIAAASGTFWLRRIANFDPRLSRLRDALGLIVLGAFASAVLSSSIGIYSLYATGIQPYSGLTEAWLIYWLGDSAGVLLVTPLVFTLPRMLQIGSWGRVGELAILLALLTGVCLVIFGDLPFIPIKLHALGFTVLPFAMWGAIRFGIAGSALSVFVIATIATILTALGSGPFSVSTPFTNAVLLDVLFAVLSVSCLSLAAVIAERDVSERDVTEGKRAEEALAALNLRLIRAQEEERARIARELHDDIGQRFSLLTARLTGVSEELHTEAAAIGVDLQTLSHELHPAKLGLLGLSGGLERLCGEVAEQHRVTVEYEGREIPGLPSDISVGLFRILQEALHNFVKHSGVAHCRVRLSATREWIHLTVCDSGVGFDLAASKTGRGLGLISMAERIKLLGRKLSFETQPGRGTMVHARVPLPPISNPSERSEPAGGT